MIFHPNGIFFNILLLLYLFRMKMVAAEWVKISISDGVGPEVKEVGKCQLVCF